MRYFDDFYAIFPFSHIYRFIFSVISVCVEYMNSEIVGNWEIRVKITVRPLVYAVFEFPTLFFVLGTK